MQHRIVAIVGILGVAALAAALESAAQAPPGNVYITDPEGDAGGKGYLDILKAGLTDDGAAFSVWAEFKALGEANPDVAAQELKIAWRFHLETQQPNASDPARPLTRHLFVQAQVQLRNGPSVPDSGVVSVAGLSFHWGTVNATGAATLHERLVGAAMEAAANRITWPLSFDDVNQAVSGQDNVAVPRIDLRANGTVAKVWLETLSALGPTYETAPSAVDEAEQLRFKQVDRGDSPLKYLTKRERDAAANAPPPPANNTTPSNRTANNTTAPTGNTTAPPTNATTNATGNETANETARGDDKKGGLPSVGPLLTAAVLAAAVVVRRLRGRRPPDGRPPAGPRG